MSTIDTASFTAAVTGFINNFENWILNPNDSTNIQNLQTAGVALAASIGPLLAQIPALAKVGLNEIGGTVGVAAALNAFNNDINALNAAITAKDTVGQNSALLGLIADGFGATAGVAGFLALGAAATGVGVGAAVPLGTVAAIALAISLGATEAKLAFDTGNNGTDITNYLQKFENSLGSGLIGDFFGWLNGTQPLSSLGNTLNNFLITSAQAAEAGDYVQLSSDNSMFSVLISEVGNSSSGSNSITLTENLDASGACLANNSLINYAAGSLVNASIDTAGDVTNSITPNGGTMGTVEQAASGVVTVTNISNVAIGTVSNGGTGTPPTYGVDVANASNVTVNAGSSNSTLTINGNVSSSLGSGSVQFDGGAGTATIDATGMASGGTVEVTAGTGAETIKLGVNETLKLDNPFSFNGTIYGFAGGDKIALEGQPGFFNSLDYNSTTHTLQIGVGSQTINLAFDSSVDYGAPGVSFGVTGGSSPGELDVIVIQNLTVASGETTSNALLGSGDTLSVQSSASASNITVDNGGIETVAGLDTNSTINDGGKQNIASGGTADNTIVNDPGIQTILAGGTANDAVLSGGEQLVYGAANGTTVGSSGTEIVESGGTASGTVDSGGVDVVLGAAGGTVLDSGGIEIPISGGTVTGARVNSGGVEVIASGGTASGLFVSSGGIDVVIGGGTEINTVLLSGGVDIVDGGTALVLSGGVASGTIVISSGVELVESGGTGSSDIIDNGGVLLVLSGGSATSAVVTSSGAEVVLGAASGAVVTSGGVEVLVSGGAASGTIVNGGGVEVVGPGGTAYGLTIGSGGVDVVVSGGMQRGTIVSGIDIVVSGTVIGATVDSGGYELVESGSIDSAVTISGGIFEVASGGSIGSGAVTFSGSGRLVLDASVSFGGLVAGFGAPDSLDLRDITFGSGTQLSFAEAAGKLSGTLTVTNGANAANIVLLGQYTASQLTAVSDGNGGTLVSDPALAAAASEPAALVSPHHA
jgi:autotransporter passenger strand-loop-strand repeat protein